MLRHVTICRAAVAVSLAWAAPISAGVTPQQLSRKLVQAFSNETGSRKYSANIIEKKYVGLKTQSVIFALGRRTYKIVFSSDQSVVVSLARDGEIGSQIIWKSEGKDVTVENVVNSIFSREFGHAYEGPQKFTKAQGSDADTAPQTIVPTSLGSDLRWNNLMNRVMRGDVATLTAGGKGNAEKGFTSAIGMSKAMDPCSSQNKSAQRAVLTDIAQAFVASNVGSGNGEFLTDRSRNYGKSKSYSALEDIEEYKDQSHPEEAFRLIQQSRSDAYDIFRTALAGTVENEKDPYRLAALRNFKTVARNLPEEDGKRVIDEVLAKTVVDVAAFTELRKQVPKASVIYEQASDQFFVDPTLNSPAQARYLLSLEVLYAWNLREPTTAGLLKKYESIQNRVSQIEDAILDESDAKELIVKRNELESLSKDLFATADRFRKTLAKPAI